MNHKDPIPLLINSYIQVADQPGTQLKDHQLRIEKTIEGIAHWLQINPDLKIVICDGSNFDFSSIVQKEFPSKHIECLHFENNKTEVALYGKGYGEGQIIDFALSHSTYLNQTSSFMKCTGKLWVTNAQNCLSHFTGNFIAKGYFSSVFQFHHLNFDYIDTRFYICSKDFYNSYVKGSYLLKQNSSVEVNLRNTIIHERIQHILFSMPLIIEGTSGASGKYYKNNLKRLLKEKLRLFILMRSKHKGLFIP